MISQPKLFASGIPQEMDEEMLAKQIERIDKSIQPKSILVLRDYQTLKSKGLAVLEFLRPQDCKWTVGK